MRISKITATALLTLSTLGFGTAVVHAQPAPPAHSAPAAPLTLSGTFHEIAYQVGLSEDQRTTVATISDGGRFDTAHDGKIVTVTDRDGRTVAAFPMAVRVAGHRVGLLPTIEDSGRRLSITPVNAAEAPVRDPDAQQRFFAEVEKSMPAILAGAGIGAAIGFLLGFPLGLFVIDFITIPITTVVGAALGACIGLAVGGGQPAIDAALAYLDAMP